MTGPKTQNPMVKVVSLTTDYDGTLYIQAEVQSRTNPNQFHLTKLKIDAENLNLKYANCTCKGFEYRKRCYHIDLLKEKIINEYRDKLEEAKKKKEELGKEALEW